MAARTSFILAKNKAAGEREIQSLVEVNQAILAWSF